ncbi:MAG: DUF2264 domain-containing protein [Clostridiales bacterium]|nr:DUF2264 domain-containing protein [Clostridiales bacterium]
MLHSKKDFRQCLLSIIDPVKPYFSEDKAVLDLGKTAVYYGKKAIYMEGISRLFWGLVPFYAGGGESQEWQQILRKALASGTNPRHPEYWGDFTNSDQKFVEMAAIAYGMLFATETIWEPLTDQEKDNLARYLYAINEYKLPECNWVLFAVLVNLALKKVVRPYSKEQLENYLNMTESFYKGDGWYQDGDSGQVDYYTSFAIHFYCLIYAVVMEKEDPVRSQRFKERANVFAKQFIYWFDDTGEALPYGRSLTYRFAQVSFFSACLLADVYPFTVEEMKGIIARHISNWLRKDIFDDSGLLTIGYGYPNLIMAEAYNAPGSPYWGLKVFAMLMLPDDHPFWSAEAAALPKLPGLSSQPYADKLMYHYGNHVTAFPAGHFTYPGHGQAVAKYGKFAYDTCFGFHVSKSNYGIYEAAPDSMLAFIVDGYCYVRRNLEEGQVEADRTRTVWIPYPGIRVETIIIPDEKGHTRKHIVHSEIQCEVFDCGFSVAGRDEDNVNSKETDNSVTIYNNFSSCTVSGEGKPMVLGTSPNTNVLYRKALIPAIRYTINKGSNEILTRVDVEVKR